LKGLSKSPSQRFQSGKELMDAMEAALNISTPTLPLLPQNNAGAESTPRSHFRLSQTSMMEIVSEHQEATVASLPDGRPELEPIKPKKKLSMLAILGIGWTVLFVLGGLAFLINYFLFNASGQQVQANALPSATERLPSPTDTLLPTRTMPPSQTAAPTNILSTSTLPAVEILETPTLIPPTETLPAPTSTNTVTEPPPQRSDGDLFKMYYDETAFYIKNLSDHDRSVYPLAFERLDKDENPETRVEGWYWGNIYSKFRANYCLVLEILNYTDHLSPKECKNRYLVFRQPTLDSGKIFWTKESDTKEFRVLWDDEEVGRCKIGAGTCEVYLPSSYQWQKKIRSSIEISKSIKSKPY